MRYVQTALVVAYLVVTVLTAWVPSGTAVFWTMLMPLLPLLVVLAGFSFWRRVCPIATLGASRGEVRGTHRRRLPPLLRRHGVAVGFALLVVALWGRLVFFNHDGVGLALLLTALPLVAWLTNRRWGGRSFCHYLCPVAPVERLYSEGGPNAARSSACSRCTGCVSACPDISPDKSYRADLRAPRRRHLAYALPGLVGGFYTYFFLREGEWEAFFDGRWARAPAEGLLGAPGLYFAPEVPVGAAALGTLLLAMVISTLAFRSLEAALRRAKSYKENALHLTQCLATFAALNLFYVFAGAPALRQVPGAPRLVAFLVPCVATLVLLRRLRFLARERTRVPRVSLPILSRASPTTRSGVSHV